MNFSNKDQIINASAEKVFRLCSNCQNLISYMPPQVTDFKSTEDSCSFTVSNMFQVTLSITEKVEFEKIVYVASNDKNIPLSLTFFLKDIHPCQTSMSVEVEMDVPIFLRSMVKDPINNVLQMLTSKIKMEAEK